jgi:hypothetical protein
MGPKSNTETGVGVTSEDRGTEWSNTATNHISRSHQKLGDRQLGGNDSHFELPQVANPTNTLISDFWLPELSKNNSCLKPIGL